MRMERRAELYQHQGRVMRRSVGVGVFVCVVVVGWVAMWRSWGSCVVLSGCGCRALRRFAWYSG